METTLFEATNYLNNCNNDDILLKKNSKERFQHIYRTIPRIVETSIETSSSKIFNTQYQQEQYQYTINSTPIRPKHTLLPTSSTINTPSVFVNNKEELQQTQLNSNKYQQNDKEKLTTKDSAIVSPSLSFNKITHLLPLLFPRNPSRKPSNLLPKIMLFCIILYSMSLFMVARGLIVMVHAILGLFFSAEGIHVTITYNLRGIKNYLFIQVLNLLISIGSELVSLGTVEQYCGGSEICLKSIRTHCFISIIFASITIPITFIVFSIFYISIHRYYDYTNFIINSRRRGVLQQFLRTIER